MSALEAAKRAWAESYSGLSQARADEQARGFGVMVRALAAEGALSAERFAEQMGLPAARAEEIFRGLSAAGVECDERGNIVGAALSLRETAHRIRVSKKDLFAWCSLDTLFIPGLLAETAAVESICPSTGEVIRLTIAPDRIENCEPAGTWLSVFLPGVQGCANEIGPASPT